ncbi:MAG: hypothetical protein RMY16_31640 [Nostoc sp. DedQUE12b]|uniref:hypothetical protein n=1 Tax=Nostoc sp. DedQUE12b TaxID=3075398 RepID=UPI002AD252BE|nr:hypothetical protein [Nostoc sp. DedQUE12b]MDZ8090073.1 hypothetical protein [Nostoc sp. DedQUE12b]
MIAAVLSLTKSPRLSGSGTDTLLREIGDGAVTPADTVFPAIIAARIIAAIVAVLENFDLKYLGLSYLNLHSCCFIFVTKDLSKNRPLEVSNK